MLRYIGKRLLTLVPVILIMTMLVFGLSSLSAGDPARVIAEQIYGSPTLEEIEQVRTEQGFDQPIYKQYARWLGNACRGEFGDSYETQKPALEEVVSRIPVTLKIAGVGLAILVAIGIPLGILSAVYEGSWVDRLLQCFVYLSVSTPSFWLGLVLLYLFGVKWRLISVIGGVSSGGILVLAAATLDIGYIGVVIQLMRTSLRDVLDQDFICACRARGLSQARVVLKHGMKSACLPIITQASGICIGLLCGSAIVESIYSIDGIGKLALQATYLQDLPVLQCYILFVTCFVVVMNLVIDIFYCLIDKRIKLD